MWVYENRRIAKERKAKMKKQKEIIKEQEKKDKVDGMNAEMTNNIKENHDDSQNLDSHQPSSEIHNKNGEQKTGEQNHGLGQSEIN